MPAPPCTRKPRNALREPHRAAESLRERRDRLGISYVTIFPPAVEAFAPIARRLAGT